MNIGERFDFALKECNISNKEIADKFNISSQNISNLKKNDRLNDLISKIASEYDININWLVTGKGHYKINSDSNIYNLQNSTNRTVLDKSSNKEDNTNTYYGNDLDIDKNILKLVDTVYSFAKENRLEELKTDLILLLQKYSSKD
ncbi:helix-turn-helix domain-containing protein [Aliarcobacter butzleri]|uniref:helix-turn-helix domain-containing protein n=1 Tax=Aliarcobacter butzleri TaxID=28197 RepID=UPI003AF55683